MFKSDVAYNKTTATKLINGPGITQSLHLLNKLVKKQKKLYRLIHSY